MKHFTIDTENSITVHTSRKAAEKPALTFSRLKSNSPT